MRLLIAALLLALVTPLSARADLSRNQARKVIQTMAGWSLPGSAVRVQDIKPSGNESAEVSAEIQAVFRLRLHEGHWQLREIRTGQDRWERLEVLANAAKVELPAGECDAPSQFARRKSDTDLTTKRARCLVATLLGVTLPSDDVRIKEVSPFGLSLGSESAALVTALIQVDFRLAREERGWRVTEFKSGTREWVNVSDVPIAIDQVKSAAANEDLSTIA